MTTAAMHQSQYIPWPPYFKKIASVDVFILMDSVQYQKNGLQNRNQVRDKNGAFWLTIPVTGALEDSIAQKRLASPAWREKHWKSLVSAYGRAPYWARHAGSLKALYARDYTTLGEVNDAFTGWMLEALGIRTRVVKLSALPAAGAKTDLVVSACTAVGADAYVSGTGAKDYLVESRFAEAGLALSFEESKPPSYPQFHGAPVPGLSMLDMMFNADPSVIGDYLGRRST
jgi:hypothetical protein